MDKQKFLTALNNFLNTFTDQNEGNTINKWIRASFTMNWSRLKDIYKSDDESTTKIFSGLDAVFLEFLEDNQTNKLNSWLKESLFGIVGSKLQELGFFEQIPVENFDKIN